MLGPMTAAPDANPGQTPDDAATERRVTLAIGIALVLVGGAFLAVRQAGIDLADAGWPLFVIVPGLVLFALAFVVGGRAGTGFAVAGSIVTVTGLVLAVQNATGLWATWAYAWALIAPGASGLGLLVYGAATRQRDLALPGAWALLTGLALFLVFAFFFESVIGLSGDAITGLDTLLSAAIVGLGVVILGVGLAGGRRRSA
jgi:hypothetical protein